MAGHRQGFIAAGQDQNQDRVRTHLLFSKKTEHTSTKRKRRTHNKLHQQLMQQHRRDEMIQTGPVKVDPANWSGNQRVLHYGPMAQRDPFFYYYPKGWDVLYPAHFGFFPYRTSKFRGSSPIICLSAFGLFFLIGGALMTLLGYLAFGGHPNWTPWSSAINDNHPPPIRVAGPIFLAVGLILIVLGFCWWLATLNLLHEKLRHTQLHNVPPKRAVRTHYGRDMPSKYHLSYQPLPPPAYPILANAYTEPIVYSPQAELKLYPPVAHGYSTLSLQGRSPASYYMSSPYNTLQAPATTRYHPKVDRDFITNVDEQRQQQCKSLSTKDQPSRSVEAISQTNHRSQP